MIKVDRAVYLLDLFVTIWAFLAAFLLHRSLFLQVKIDFHAHSYLLPILLFFIVFFLSYFGAYTPPRRQNYKGYVWAVFCAVFLTIVTLLSILFFLKIEYVSRVLIFSFAIFEFAFIILIRSGLRAYFLKSIKKGSKNLHVLIIGTGERAKELSRILRKQAEWGAQIIGHLDPDPERVGQRILGSPVIGTTDDITDVFKKYIVDEVIIAITRSMLEDAEHIAHACDDEGIKLQLMTDLFSLKPARIRLAQLADISLLTLEPVAQSEIKLLIKYFFDFLFTLLSLPIILPIMVIIAIAIKLDSKGPVFFTQQRVGLRKRQFPMLKFRSMYVDAEERMKEIEHLNEAEGPIFKIKNDPRITRVGRFIRKTSLDELPQLFNVLTGSMSIVGPRPMSIRDVDLFDKGIQRKRFSVKPGITCIWQISGRSDLPFEKWLELDLQYIENWSLWMDMKILFKTIPAVLLSKGAA